MLEKKQRNCFIWIWIIYLHQSQLINSSLESDPVTATDTQRQPPSKQSRQRQTKKPKSTKQDTELSIFVNESLFVAKISPFRLCCVLRQAIRLANREAMPIKTCHRTEPNLRCKKKTANAKREEAKKATKKNTKKQQQANPTKKANHRAKATKREKKKRKKKRIK